MPTNVQLFTCPLCGEAASEAVALRDHLGSEHGLTDDPGTDTLASLQLPPEPEPEPESETPETGGAPEQKPHREEARKHAREKPQRERPTRVKPAKAKRPERQTKPRPERAARPKREAKSKAPKGPTVPLTERIAARLRARRVGPPVPRRPGEPYPLATRYGDIALYAPGALLLLLGLLDDRVGWAVVGVALLVLGMLLPVVHAFGTFVSTRQPDQPGVSRADVQPVVTEPEALPSALEDTLLGLSRPPADPEMP